MFSLPCVLNVQLQSWLRGDIQDRLQCGLTGSTDACPSSTQIAYSIFMALGDAKRHV